MQKYLAFFFLILNFTVKADSWDSVRFTNLESGKVYDISIGTGFFVSKNFILTNYHVVKDCINIAVRGEIPPNLVSLVSYDDENDLALLQTTETPKRVATFRANLDFLEGEKVFVIGYPLDNGKTGKYLMGFSDIISDTKDDFGNIIEIEFSNIVDHGNSGGPLLDGNANIIGVVKARKTYISENSNFEQSYGLAIGPSIIFSFLKKNNIVFYTNYSYDIFTNYHLDKIAKEYLVNIHCIKL